MCVTQTGVGTVGWNVLGAITPMMLLLVEVVSELPGGVGGGWPGNDTV